MLRIVTFLTALAVLGACEDAPQQASEEAEIPPPDACRVLNQIVDSLAEIDDPYRPPDYFIEPLRAAESDLERAIDGQRDSLPGLAEGMEPLRPLVRAVIGAGASVTQAQVDEVRTEMARIQDEHLPGCEIGEEEPSPAPSPAPPEDSDEGGGGKPKPGEAPAGYEFPDDSNYEVAFMLCREYGVEEIAREFGTAQDPVSAAEGYAEGYREGYQDAPYVGCLEGFLARGD